MQFSLDVFPLCYDIIQHLNHQSVRLLTRLRRHFGRFFEEQLDYYSSLFLIPLRDVKLHRFAYISIFLKSSKVPISAIIIIKGNNCYLKTFISDLFHDKTLKTGRLNSESHFPKTCYFHNPHTCIISH